MRWARGSTGRGEQLVEIVIGQCLESIWVHLYFCICVFLVFLCVFVFVFQAYSCILISFRLCCSASAQPAELRLNCISEFAPQVVHTRKNFLGCLGTVTLLMMIMMKIIKMPFSGVLSVLNLIMIFIHIAGLR